MAPEQNKLTSVVCLILGHKPEQYEPEHHSSWSARLQSWKCIRCKKDLCLTESMLAQLASPVKSFRYSGEGSGGTPLSKSVPPNQPKGEVK